MVGTETNFYMVFNNALGWKRSDIAYVSVSRNDTYEVLRSNDGTWETSKWSVEPNLNYAKVVLILIS